MLVEKLCLELHEKHEFSANLISLALLHFLICHSANTPSEWRLLFNDFCDEMEAHETPENIH